MKIFSTNYEEVPLASIVFKKGFGESQARRFAPYKSSGLHPYFIKEFVIANKGSDKTFRLYQG